MWPVGVVTTLTIDLYLSMQSSERATAPSPLANGRPSAQPECRRNSKWTSNGHLRHLSG
ncbi:hypothetical protein HDF14_001364 [Edaphobacter lichenicola]|jgi:hypothetical protein|uniref:Uncharacterized protein n=1 Tax=Tunturiibacter gelidiferens TaxID=3069689 RepID=A0A9X0U2Z0_9BACT|nr:hypothetical protein [Edaphobacter lichenicola]